MADENGIREAIVGPDDTDPKSMRCNRAIKAVHQGSAAVFEKLQLEKGETIAVMAAMVGIYAEETGTRQEAALILEKWAELLRSDKQVRWSAAGNA